MADIGNDVFFATIPELNARLKSKEFSAQELAKAFNSRLAQLGGRYNALALPLPQQAIRNRHPRAGQSTPLPPGAGQARTVPFEAEVSCLSTILNADS